MEKVFEHAKLVNLQKQEYQMKSISVIFLLLIISGCSKDECTAAKELFVEYHRVYTESVYRGKHGASAPGLAESIALLELSKQKCKAPDLEIKDIVSDYVKNPKNCSKGDLWEMMYCKK